MFRRRWSTISLVTVATLVAVSSFYQGRLSALHSLKRTSPRSLASAAPAPSSVAQSISITPLPADPVPAKWNDRWTELSAKPATPNGEGVMTSMIEELAQTDPQRAIGIATNQINLRLRAALLRAALKGWGKANPESAIEWAESQTVVENSQAINAVLQGAVHDPDKAVRATISLMTKHPERSQEFGTDLISAFAESGQFARAASFAANGNERFREDWMLPAYSRWAEFQPQAAAANALQITDPATREMALHAIINGWAPSDPLGMMEFARNNFSPDQQSAAVARAIGFWATSDPVAAANWLNQHEPNTTLDDGVAEIALSSQLNQKPSVAVSWAESIMNAQLRSETLQTILDKWASIDLSAAKTYVNNSPLMTPEDRIAFEDRLKLHSEP